MNEKISKNFIVITKNANGDIHSHGSAFFIGGDGFFVTAAHTFKNPFFEYFALINEIEYQIKRYYSEYLDLDFQKPPIYEDLFIGKVEGITDCNYYELDIQESVMQEGDSLHLAGFMKRKNGKPEAKEEIVHQDDLFVDVSSDDYEGINESVSEDIIEFKKFDAKFLNLAFKHISKYSLIEEDFTNGISIDLLGKEPHGHSGGPLIFADKVVGMLIGKDAAISSSYISEKRKEVNMDNSRNVMSLIVPESSERNWLANIINSVHDKLSKSSLAYQDSWKFFSYVSSEDVRNLDPAPKLIDIHGPALLQLNYCRDGKPTHLICINYSLCEELGFTMPELEAIVMHEIGHVLNMYEIQEISEFPNRDTDSTANTDSVREFLRQNQSIQQQNELNRELYADDFVRQNGYILPLIETMEKYLGSNRPQNEKLMKERIEYFKQISTDVLKGGTISLASNC
ncbi:hypothetical protein [Sphingobacterium sp. 18053]|uniref:hypothetical protein n=1 Tax=Sphingobacterium sp. 18053 TaxID=2681401 RepID=UPI00135A7984|nr:hypothetical protein [Sphingobacterium sp. 18053]